jgi:hypothetical protein
LTIRQWFKYSLKPSSSWDAGHRPPTGPAREPGD